MNKLTKLIASGAIAAFALVACGPQNGANAPAPSQQANLNSNVLQFAVGTVNLFGTANGGLNVVATYRQPAGATLPGGSATLLNSPTLTLPAAIAPATAAIGPEAFDPCSTAAFGSSATEVGTTTMTSTSQAPGTSCATTSTTFGQSGGVYGLGIEPYNAVGQGQYAAAVGIYGPSADGSPYQVAPYPVPIYDTTNAGCATAPLCDVNQMDAAWGGPPAVVATGSGGDSIAGSGYYPTGSAGISMGIDVFQGVAAVAGAYKLSVSVPANTGTVTQSTSFTLPAVNNLGSAGVAPGITEVPAGGGTVQLVAPPGPTAWTEALLEITDYATGAWYTLVAKNGAAGVDCTAALLCTLPNTIGPGATMSIGTPGTDMVVTQVIWVDYPLYELQYGTQTGSSVGKTAPTLLGAAGAADMSISARTCTMVVAGDCNASLPLLHARRNGTNAIQRKH